MELRHRWSTIKPTSTYMDQQKVRRYPVVQKVLQRPTSQAFVPAQGSPTKL